MDLLIYIAVIWILALVTGWFAWIGYLRLRVIKAREKHPKPAVGDTAGGVFIPDEGDDGRGDQREAFNEHVAQMRGRWERRGGT